MPEKPPSKPKRRYLVHCDFCGKNVVITQSDDLDGLHEYKLSKVPGGSPTFDAGKKEVVAKKSMQRRKMFRCPECGRGVVVRNYMTPLTEVKEKDGNDKENLGPRREASSPGPPLPGDAP